MQLVGARNQIRPDRLYDSSGTIVTGGTAQLALAEANSRGYLVIENIGTENIYLDFGCARATATLVGNSITGATVTNAGFGFTVAPIIEFLGGGNRDMPFQGRPAQAHCVLSGGVVASIVMDDPGSGYLSVPRMQLTNGPTDRTGVANPTVSKTAGGAVLLIPQGSLTMDATTCVTDAISIVAATTGTPYTIKFIP